MGAFARGVMLNHLRYFVAIVEHGSFTAASSALGISQPALTRSLQTLESQLDVTLLERGGGRIAPTAAGALLLTRARGLLAEEASLLADLATLGTSYDPVTYVNGSPLTALSLLPRVLIRLARTHPSCRVFVRGESGANYDWKRQALRSGELDAILTLHDPELDDPALQQTLLFEPELRFVVSSGHALARDPDPDLSALANERVLLPPRGSPPRKLIEAEFQVRGLSLPDRAVEVSDWRIALQLVRSGEFVTVMPYHPCCFTDELRELTLLPPRARVRALSVALVTRTLASQRESTRLFAEAVRRTVEEHASPPPEP
jgi:DNA-binding transcriptional LysR family regulator